MDLVEEVDALELEGVVGGTDDGGIVGEFLDVDDGDFELAGVVVDGLGGFDVAGELLAGINLVDGETSTAKLTGGLDEQVDAIDDEVELGDVAARLEVVGEVFDVVESEGGFAAALAEGQSPLSAVRFGNAVAGISVTRPGTAPSMPARAEIDGLLARS